MTTLNFDKVYRLYNIMCTASYIYKIYIGLVLNGWNFDNGMEFIL